MHFKANNSAGTPLGTSTSGINYSAQLVSGTAVQIVGSGLNLTAPPSTRRLVVQMTTTSAPIEGKRAVVSRRTKHRKAKVAQPVPEIAAFIERRAKAHVSGEIQLAKISAVARTKSGLTTVRMFGKPGTATGPTAKSYDVDLDDYQN